MNHKIHNITGTAVNIKEKRRDDMYLGVPCYMIKISYKDIHYAQMEF